MILKDILIHRRGFALAVLISMSITAFAQQGWSQLDSIRLEGKTATLNSVYFDGDRLWLVGADGLILSSADYGQTFQHIDSRLSVGLNDVYLVKDRVWVIGDAGTILFSTDDGRSFVKNLYVGQRKSSAGSDQGQGDSTDLYSVQFIDREKGFVVGDQGLILASTDGGVSWRQQDSKTAAQLFHLSVRGKHGWVVGSGGTILHTDDAGANWYPQRSGADRDLNRVSMVTDEIGFITGDKGVLLRTDNGGATWTQTQLQTDQPLFGISFVDKKTGWVVGYGGIITRTYDGGRSWIQQESGTSGDLFAVMLRKNRGFAIGRDGLVLRYFERR